MGLKTVLLGGDGWGNPKLLELAKGAAEGAYFTNFYSAQNPSPATARFLEAFRTKYGFESDNLAAAGYDATGILLDAIARANELTPAAVREQIARTKNYAGATGRITINAGGNADKDVFVVQIKGESYKFIKVFSD